MIKTILHTAIQSNAITSPDSLESFKVALIPKAPVVPDSLTWTKEGLFMLVETENLASLVVLTSQERVLSGFSGDSLTEYENGTTYYAIVCPLDHSNAVSLRQIVHYTAPTVLTCSQSFGTGDRIGGSAPATPWHLEICKRYNMTPVLAQQSVRENYKTGRTFEQVLDDAAWSVFRCGFKSPWGSDADHLKSLDDIEEAVRAGFTMFTLDPSDLIDNDADSDSDDTLRRKFETLFPDRKQGYAFISRYECHDNADSRMTVRSGVKYLSAIRHAIDVFRRIKELRGESGFNFELSIDETTTPTTTLDHRIIAGECIREGVELFSLAPRFEGAFEKGIDYRGSISEFRSSLETHTQLARELGGYRLSLHSGSDKFSIYRIFGEVTDGFYHVKTAGTSFLEAVKVVALTDFELFKNILTLAVDTFEENAASYQISADVNRLPEISELKNSEAVKLIESSPDMRQTLHIAFGVVLSRMGDDLRSNLLANKEVYRNCILTHLGKHLALLTGKDILND